MAGPVKYLSGRQDKLKIGIPDYNQETTTLQVFGRVGVGTTNATSDLLSLIHISEPSRPY